MENVHDAPPTGLASGVGNRVRGGRVAGRWQVQEPAMRGWEDKIETRIPRAADRGGCRNPCKTLAGILGGRLVILEI